MSETLVMHRTKDCRGLAFVYREELRSGMPLVASLAYYPGCQSFASPFAQIRCGSCRETLQGNKITIHDPWD